MSELRPIYRGGRLIAYKDANGNVVSHAKTAASAPMARHNGSEITLTGGDIEDSFCKASRPEAGGETIWLGLQDR